MNWASLIPLLTPLVVWAGKAALPNVPKVVLPIATPVIGALGDVVLYYLGLKSDMNPAMGAVYGAAGVAVREIVDQFKKATSPA